MSKPNPSITSGAAKAPGAISAGAKRKKIIFTVIKIVAVIGVIIGLVFGIIALVRALSDPCAHSPGTSWNKETKLCEKPQKPTPPIPKCKNDQFSERCQNKASLYYGLCMDKNYCTYMNHDDDHYVYDPVSCECTLSCPEGLKPYTFDGQKSTIIPPPAKGNGKLHVDLNAIQLLLRAKPVSIIYGTATLRLPFWR